LAEELKNEWISVHWLAPWPTEWDRVMYVIYQRVAKRYWLDYDTMNDNEKKKFKITYREQIEETKKNYMDVNVWYYDSFEIKPDGRFIKKTEVADALYFLLNWDIGEKTWNVLWIDNKWIYCLTHPHFRKDKTNRIEWKKYYTYLWEWGAQSLDMDTEKYLTENLVYFSSEFWPTAMSFIVWRFITENIDIVYNWEKLKLMHLKDLKVNNYIDLACQNLDIDRWKIWNDIRLIDKLKYESFRLAYKEKYGEDIPAYPQK